MSTKTPIPAIRVDDARQNQINAAVKQNLDTVTGQTKNSIPLTELLANATLEEVIERLNILIARVK